MKANKNNCFSMLLIKKPSLKTWFFGGDGEDRTLDLLNAIQALSRCTQKCTPVVLLFNLNIRLNTLIFPAHSLSSSDFKICFNLRALTLLLKNKSFLVIYSDEHTVSHTSNKFVFSKYRFR